MKTLTILMPVFNDWQSFILLVEKIDSVIASSSLLQALSINIVVVNDGSTQEYTFVNNQWSALRNVHSINVVHLTRNMGHQRAIAIGLAYVHEQKSSDAVVVMDSDGEDKPEDISTLVQASADAPHKVVFAHRAKRSEGIAFRVFYKLYKFTYNLLTGTQISFGNFSIVPDSQLEKLVFVTELWTNYPAGTLKARVPVTTVATERGKRLAGESKMNFVSLVLHGLSSIAVYLEVVAVRMLIVSAVFITLSFVGIGFVLYWRLFTALAIPGWASNAIGVLIGILLQALLLSVFLVFLVLNSRTQQVSTPHIQYAHFIRRVESLFHRS